MKQKQRVVVADDSITIQKLVNLTLAGLNFEIITSMDGHDALMKIKRLRPQLVLADADLQDVSGQALCEQIRADSDLLDTRIVLLQGSSSAGVLEAMPCDLVLQKPFDSKALIAAVERVLNDEPATRVQKPQEEVEVTDAPESPPPMDEAEEETKTRQTEGLFSSFRKAESSVDLNSRLAAIAAEIAPAHSASSEESEEPEPAKPQAVVSEEEVERSEKVFVEALDQADSESEQTDIAYHKKSPVIAPEQVLSEAKEMARSEIKKWMDQNMRGLVEELVKEELAKGLTGDSEAKA